ncbi:glucose-1-phosphate thymidylyltransferase [Barnesiella viscericola DSM 18177]|uniref:Glucose-1-phosphate thymidylyltransferase n=1 Tax=Barnesiella viscericola DSM 18177 TaxID=880074 RepID=W0EUI4_9BACT|nr:putative sugar nucleotidyl transferase [Barnesiella viscericola]AHF12746.1 glucose-1-phosphate thymidylyltransferase [Barnesiella viscericola DSM 18177]
MKNIILFDINQQHLELLPLAFTRPIADIRIGILTIREKWERMLSGNYSYLTPDYMAGKYPAHFTDDNLFIAGHLIPDEELARQVNILNPGEALIDQQTVVAFRGSEADFRESRYAHTLESSRKLRYIQHLYDIFLLNGECLEADFKLITRGRTSQPLSPSNRIIGDPCFADGTSKIFVEPGAKAECAIFNVTNGPIYLGADSEVMEGSCIRAPFAACEHAYVNMGTKIYGATTLGPYCKVGGELNNVVMFGFSNKAHDGFLGNAVIGEWCNLGAGAVASNLKNDYSEIKLWNYPTRRFLPTHLQFCGLIMGDHSKAGINTMFNTATVIGVGVNIHGAGFPRNFVASFSEGGTAGFTDVQLPKFYAIAEKIMARRGRLLTEADKTIFEAIYNQAEQLK